MNDALPHCHQKPMYKQTVPCQGYAQSVSTDAGGVKCLLMFIWRKLTSAETNSVFYERIFYRIVVYRTNEYSTILSLLISDVTNLYA